MNQKICLIIEEYQILEIVSIYFYRKRDFLLPHDRLQDKIPDRTDDTKIPLAGKTALISCQPGHLSFTLYSFLIRSRAAAVFS